MSKLSIAIQHHPSRLKRKKDLLEQLQDDRVKVIAEGDLWNNCKACLRSYDKDSTHILVLQDDIEVCRDFIPTVEKLIELRPNDHITLFTNRNAQAELAYKEGKKWLRIKRWLMAQAYVVPVSMVEPFIEFADKNLVDGMVVFDDDRWCVFHLFNHTPVYATVPSLVQHLDWNNTTIGDLYGKSKEAVLKLKDSRTSQYYIGKDRSGFEFDWEDLDYFDDTRGHILMYKHAFKSPELFETLITKRVFELGVEDNGRKEIFS